MRLLSGIVFLFALALASGAASAQPFPNKPIRIVIGFPPGGGNDIVARILAPKLSEGLGQQVIVDNRPGANGIIATDFVAKAPPDGYAVFFGSISNLSVNPLLYAKLPFDMARDFAPLTQVASVAIAILVNPSFPARTVRDLIAIAKARPGQINYSSSGNGSIPHLAAELFKMMAGVKMVHIPYKGSAPSVIDVIAGQVPLTFGALLSGLPHVRSGRLRAIAMLGPTRSELLPGVPAAAETLPGYEVVNWYGMVVPVATPRVVIAHLHGEIVKVLRLPEIRDNLVAQGADPVGSSPEEFAVFMKSESAKWARVIKQADIRAD